MERTEMRSSPSRVARARRPSGEMATWLTPDFSSPRASVPAGATVFPSMVKMEIEPPLRLATSARVPWRLIETPDGPLPVSSVARTAGSEGNSSRMRISLADREGLQEVRQCRRAMLEDGGEVRPGDLLGEARRELEVLDGGISEVNRAAGPFAANAVQRGDAHELQ